jgi:hypothetical protein
MKHDSRLIALALAASGILAPAALAQGRGGPGTVQIPANAIALEGIPTVRVDSAVGDTTRRVLSQHEATNSRLVVNIVDGKYYWTSRDNHRLRLDASGPFTYLSSEPGSYIRFTRIDDKVAYVEHVDMPLGSVTWWGELEIILKK